MRRSPRGTFALLAAGLWLAGCVEPGAQAAQGVAFVRVPK